MPVYIKTDTDDALINAIEISNNGNFVFSASTISNQKDSELLSLDDSVAEASETLPWEPDSSVVCDLPNTISNEDINDGLLRINGSYALQQFGEYISSTGETSFNQKMIQVMAKIMSTSAFIALGHPKD